LKDERIEFNFLKITKVTKIVEYFRIFRFMLKREEDHRSLKNQRFGKLIYVTEGHAGDMQKLVSSM